MTRMGKPCHQCFSQARLSHELLFLQKSTATYGLGRLFSGQPNLAIRLHRSFLWPQLHCGNDILDRSDFLRGLPPRLGFIGAPAL